MAAVAGRRPRLVVRALDAQQPRQAQHQHRQGLAQAALDLLRALAQAAAAAAAAGRGIDARIAADDAPTQHLCAGAKCGRLRRPDCWGGAQRWQCALAHARGQWGRAVSYGVTPNPNPRRES